MKNNFVFFLKEKTEESAALEIASLMFYPGNEELRRIWITQALLLIVSKNYENKVKKGCSDAELEDFIMERGKVLGGMFHHFGYWPSLSSWITGESNKQTPNLSIPKLKELTIRGRHVGFVLDIAIAHQCSINRAAEMYCGSEEFPDACIPMAEEMNESLQIRLTKSWFCNKIWPEYERVAHLWGVNIKIRPPIKDPFSLDIVAFPPNGVSSFIEEAEKVLDKANTIIPPKRGKPLLAKDTSIKIIY